LAGEVALVGWRADRRGHAGDGCFVARKAEVGRECITPPLVDSPTRARRRHDGPRQDEIARLTMRNQAARETEANQDIRSRSGQPSCLRAAAIRIHRAEADHESLPVTVGPMKNGSLAPQTGKHPDPAHIPIPTRRSLLFMRLR
jgi:hypothetical protein